MDHQKLIRDCLKRKVKKADDALRVKVKPGKAAAFTEKMTFTISKKGKVTLLWGYVQVDFKVE